MHVPAEAFVVVVEKSSVRIVSNLSSLTYKRNLGEHSLNPCIKLLLSNALDHLVKNALAWQKDFIVTK